MSAAWAATAGEPRSGILIAGSARAQMWDEIRRCLASTATGPAPVAAPRGVATATSPGPDRAEATASRRDPAVGASDDTAPVAPRRDPPGEPRSDAAADISALLSPPSPGSPGVSLSLDSWVNLSRGAHPCVPRTCRALRRQPCTGTPAAPPTWAGIRSWPTCLGRYVFRGPLTPPDSGLPDMRPNTGRHGDQRRLPLPRVHGVRHAWGRIPRVSHRTPATTTGAPVLRDRGPQSSVVLAVFRGALGGHCHGLRPPFTTLLGS